MGLLVNGAINPLLKALGKNAKTAEVLGVELAQELINKKGLIKVGKEMKQFGVLGGMAHWVGQGANFGQKAARFGVAYGATMAGARIISGGGVYRDRHGKFDLIGVPFI